MSADILAFPARPDRAGSGGLEAPKSAAQIRTCAVGDLVLLCINASIGLWAAWPVAAVDDDGVLLAVWSPAGKMLGAERVSCDPSFFLAAASDHEPDAFGALCWKTWRDVGEALTAFAGIQQVAGAGLAADRGASDRPSPSPSSLETAT